MKLTERDVNLFKLLNKSEIGKDLVDYLNRVSDYIADSRTWEEGETKESANRAALAIKRHVCDKIRLQQVEKQADPRDSLI